MPSAPRTCSWVSEKYQPILEVSFLVIYLLFILNWKGQWFHSITIIGHDDQWQSLVDVISFVEPEGSVISISLPYPSIPHYHIHSLVSMLHLNRLKRVQEKREKRDPNVISKPTHGLCSYYYAARACSILLNSKSTKAALSIHLITAPNASYSLSSHPFPMPQMANSTLQLQVLLSLIR